MTQSVLYMTCLMSVATILLINYTGKESREKIQFAVYISDTPVTLKEGEGDQTWYESVDHKQDYNHAQFERPPLNSVQGKANVTVFDKSGNHLLSPLNTGGNQT